MGFENYISETEAAALAGVSVKTLNRFAEAGYLHIESDSDGLHLFSKRELGEVFGITESLVSFTSDVDPSESTREDRPPSPGLTDFSRSLSIDSSDPLTELAPASCEAGEEVLRDEEIKACAGEVDELETRNFEEPVKAEPREFAADGVDQEVVDVRDGSDVEPDIRSDKKTENVIDTDQVEPLALDSKDLDFFKPVARRLEKIGVGSLNNHDAEREVVRLKSIVDLQEKLLDARDAEIADLHKQRDWLQARVERQEEKSDRDQLLLLSETQLLRQTLLHQQKRSSVFKGALEWLGLLPAPGDTAAHAGTIEVGRKQTQDE